ncbi:hypothetical protein DFH07DRAFT_768837 [Mycena maculata]|uniref:Uncharacterized protein n=1 Tax=Mycena maculata TaxID=230809 RepID=A0AAD7JQV5_9AGAR|nr:hypothetical protein DFH07DRAFT_768837 [Mycena maculata]
MPTTPGSCPHPLPSTPSVLFLSRAGPACPPSADDPANPDPSRPAHALLSSHFCKGEALDRARDAGMGRARVGRDEHRDSGRTPQVSLSGSVPFVAYRMAAFLLIWLWVYFFSWECGFSHI